VRCETERSQSYNKETALSILRARLHQLVAGRVHEERADDRRRQIGSGQRGDKRRTIAVQRDSVVDHVTGCEWRFADYQRGKW
jgi:peptide chain release factor 1